MMRELLPKAQLQPPISVNRRPHMSTPESQEILKILNEYKTQNDEFHSTQTLQLDQIKTQLDNFKPMYQIFQSATGFSNITVIIFKAILLIGAVVGAIYTFVRWIKTPL